MAVRSIAGALLAVLLAVPAAASPPAWDTVVALPDALRAELDRRVIGPTRSPHRRLQLLGEFMFSPDGLALEYDHATTRTVAETYRDRKGNCLSFTITFIALARQAGLAAYAQELDHVLLSFRDDRLVIRSGHVNVGMRVGSRRHTIEFDGLEIISTDKPRRISDSRTAAHFYNNRGAERLAAGDHAAARTHLDAALAIEPEFVAAWSNLGVLNVREGAIAAAERAYAQALRLDPEHASTLSNVLTLHEVTGRRAELSDYKHRLKAVRLRDPIYNFQLGLQHESRGDYDSAVDAYGRAVRLHHHEPRFHLALSRAYSQNGDSKRAERAARRAVRHERATGITHPVLSPRGNAG